MNGQGNAATRPRLEVEPLESRLVPDATSYVRGLYHTLLLRDPGQDELTAQVSLLQNGHSEREVAAGFYFSAEHRGLQVDQYYARYLKRDSDVGGRQAFVNYLVNGTLSETQTQLVFLSSAEYRSVNAGDNGTLVDALYNDVLGRPSDAQGKAAFTNFLNAGISTSVVAQAFLTSDEGLLHAVDLDYHNLLGRDGDPAGRQSWLSQLRDNDLLDTQNHATTAQFLATFDGAGSSLEEVAINFLTSQEFNQNANSIMA